MDSSDGGAAWMEMENVKTARNNSLDGIFMDVILPLPGGLSNLLGGGAALEKIEGHEVAGARNPTCTRSAERGFFHADCVSCRRLYLTAHYSQKGEDEQENACGVAKPYDGWGHNLSFVF